MIRRMQRADIDRVADIWLDTNIRAHNFISKQYWQNNFSIVKEMLSQSEIYVYEEKNEIQGFDGVHMDQYGDPKEALILENGKYVIRDLADDFGDLINETKEKYPEKQLIFNAVNNWPVDSVKKSREDCVYIEVWSPNDTYRDLYRLIAHARGTKDEKRVILAAYLNPFKIEPERNLNGSTEIGRAHV